MGVHIWKDPWIPRDSVRTPLTPRGNTLLSEVQELLHPTTGSWDITFVRELFWEEDAEIILAIPVHSGRANSPAWHFDKHGQFSVKSAYKVSRDIAKRANCANGGTGSSSSGDCSGWKKLWKLNCPSKVNHFLWRLAHNSHPLRCNLIRRGMQIESNCIVCGCVGEDGGHLFFKCKLAKHLWRSLNLEQERKHLATIPEAFAAVEYILSQREQKRELMAITMYFIWSERNRIREEGIARPAEVIVRCIETYAHENVQSKTKIHVPATGSAKRWSKPVGDCLKLNVDGSFRDSEKNGSWGFIIRDSDGDAVVAGRGKIDSLLSAFQAELVACLQGLQCAADMGIANMMMETDAQEVVTAISSTKYDDSVTGHIIEEIKLQVELNFLSFSCKHVSRSCNSTAHELASLGYLCPEGEMIISDIIPEGVAVIVATESVANE